LLSPYIKHACLCFGGGLSFVVTLFSALVLAIWSAAIFTICHPLWENRPLWQISAMEI